MQSDPAFLGGYKIKTRLCVNASIPFDRIILSQNERVFDNHCPLTLKPMASGWYMKVETTVPIPTEKALI